MGVGRGATASGQGGRGPSAEVPRPARRPATKRLRHHGLRGVVSIWPLRTKRRDESGRHAGTSCITLARSHRRGQRSLAYGVR
eukprot:6906711-Prymnesium_polylepis.1